MAQDYIDFEIEATSIKDAKEKIAAFQAAFGKDTIIKVKMVSGNKDKLLSTLEDGSKKLMKQIGEKIAKEKFKED